MSSSDGQIQTTETKLEIGPYQVLAAPTGVFGLDGGAMFGTVPKVLWEKTNPPDEQNRIPLEARALLLKSNERNILVDVGIGADFVEKYGDRLGPKFAEIYAVNSDTTLQKSLAKHGLQPDDITDVVLTHFHFDHAGGSTCWRNGRLVPTFAKARYYVQEDNLKTALNPNLREKASYFPANIKPLQEAGVLTVLKGPKDELLPGISVFMSYGHTAGQQLVKVSDGKNTLVYCGDVIPTSTHIRLPFVMGYDLDPLRLIEEKRQILTQAAREGWYIFFEHDPYVDAAQVSAQKDDFAARAKFRFL